MLIWDLIHKLSDLKKHKAKSLTFVTPDGKQWTLSGVVNDPRRLHAYLHLTPRGKYEDQPPHAVAGWNPNTD